MSDDFLGVTLFFGIVASIGTSFIIGNSFGYDDGLVDGKNEGIVFCMDKPKECKTTYDYLKLQENQK
jgi:hypothetical protein